MNKFITTAAVAALALGFAAEAAQAQSRGRDRDRGRDGVSVGEVVALIDLGARLLGSRDRDDHEEQAASTDYLLEIDGVRGESSDDYQGGVFVAAGDVNGDGRADGRQAGPRDIERPDHGETAGLLLPAVQRVREAAASQSQAEPGAPSQVQGQSGQGAAVAVPSLLRNSRRSGH
ncbi:hypothetical protein [Brevundimonas sp.]|uniref:hypothetical protein n=1 Tax=Brevundimonas sp. TaxID=1871086 RepID=UPI0025F5432E|nr:hypothetical protein [Brevundimonas sp.]